MSSVRSADDENRFYFFPDDAEEGSPIEVIDGKGPLFIADGKTLETYFLFGCCPDQATKTALYEWVETKLFELLEPALLDRNWLKCSNLIRVLSECDFSVSVTSRKRKMAP